MVTTEVTTSTIAVAAGRPHPAKGSDTASQWQMWIDDACMLIDDGMRRRSLASAVLDQATVDYVVRQAVVEMVRRPEDVTQVDVSVDDGRVSKRYATGKGLVVIRPDWWDLLLPDRKDDSGAFSTRPGFASAVP